MEKLMRLGFIVLMFISDRNLAETSPIRFTHLSTQQGLSNNFISSICQDREGFLWFGTADGLNKFDGYQFTKFQFDPRAGSNTLKHTIITDVHQDHKGRLWVATMGGGLHQVDNRTGKVTVYNHPLKLSYYWDVIFNLFEDRQGILWLGTPLGLLRFDPVTKNFTKYPMERVNHIIGQSANGDLLVEVKSRGKLFRFNRQSGRFSPILIQLPKLRHNPKVWRRAASGRQFALPYQRDKPVSPYAFLLDKGGQLWIGTEGDGLFWAKMTGDTLRPVAYNPKGLVYQAIYESGLYEDNAGFLWVCSPDGLQRIHPETHELVNYQSDGIQPGSLSSNDVHAILRDRTGNIWIGTDNGVDQLLAHPKPFQTYPARIPQNQVRLPAHNFQAVLQDHTGTIWLGSIQKGLYRWVPSNQKLEHIPANPSDPNRLASDGVSTLFEDRAGQVWVSTKEALHLLDRVRGTFTRFPTQVPAMCIDQGADGRLWIGGSVGLKGAIGCLDLATGKFRYYTRDVLRPKSEATLTPNRTLSHFLILDVLASRTGTIWIATARGLNRLDPATGTFTYYQAGQEYSPGKLTDNWVRALYEDGQGMLWIGTNHGGLNRFDPRTARFSYFGTKDGLPSNRVVSIAPDNLGNLWLGTGHGISRFNPSARNFRNFDAADGLPDNEFNLGSVHSANGRLLFGSINGAVGFHASQIKENNVLPKVYLTGLTVQQERRPVPQGALELPHEGNSISFEFVALNYDTPEKNQYAFQLTGLDRDWIYCGSQRFARYTNLEPGTYTFRVKASNNDGMWNQTGASLQVIILPPWWETGWAYAGYAAILCMLIWLARRNLINRERLRSELKLERLTAEKMQELDALKSDFFANLSHEFRTPLSLIKAANDSLHQQHGTDMHNSHYQLIERQAGHLLNMVNQILDLSRLESGKLALVPQSVNLSSFLLQLSRSFVPLFESRNLTFRYTVPMQTLWVSVDQDKLSGIISNLLTNATKFTPNGGQVQFSALVDDRQSDKISLRFVVQDTGIGIPDNQLPHIFDRFFQADGSATRSYEGTGIGLALVKELVALHRGVIDVESDVGKGTTFTVQLTFTSVDPDLQANPTVPSEAHRPYVQPVQHGQPQSAAQRARLLIIEDHPDLRSFLVDCFAENYDTIAVDNGSDGFEQAITQFPDLIISDVMMPGINGMELCRRLKTDERTSHIPIVLLTAKAAAESKRAGLQTGADEYLTKPFDRQELLLRVENLLESRRKLRDRFSKQLLVQPAEVTVNSTDERFLQQVFTVLETNLSDASFDVAAFSIQMAISQTHLHRKLTALVGQSANELIRSFRLKRAASLLIQQHGNVSEIAFMVGFTNPNYFAKCFRDQFGQTPTAYARLHSPAQAKK
jgi:signal transduction histidine kinase/ligand-binding sensor domain-containing protein/DNA-binding response OmpR family regulator